MLSDVHNEELLCKLDFRFLFMVSRILEDPRNADPQSEMRSVRHYLIIGELAFICVGKLNESVTSTAAR